MGPRPFMLGGAEEGRKVTLGQGFYRIDIFRHHEAERSCAAAEIILDDHGASLLNEGEIRFGMSHVPREVNGNAIFTLLCFFR